MRLAKPRVAFNHSHERMLHETIKGSFLARFGNAGGSRCGGSLAALDLNLA